MCVCVTHTRVNLKIKIPWIIRITMQPEPDTLERMRHIELHTFYMVGTNTENLGSKSCRNE